jgi:hypothetical protein
MGSTIPHFSYVATRQSRAFRQYDPQTSVVNSKAECQWIGALDVKRPADGPNYRLALATCSVEAAHETGNLLVHHLLRAVVTSRVFSALDPPRDRLRVNKVGISASR